MSTPKQLHASRANGARSKGPVTEQSKRNSARNSTSTASSPRSSLLTARKPLDLHQGVIEEHHPQTPTETMLVEAITAARWRQDRIWSLQLRAAAILN